MIKVHEYVAVLNNFKYDSEGELSEMHVKSVQVQCRSIVECVREINNALGRRRLNHGSMPKWELTGVYKKCYAVNRKEKKVCISA